MGGDISKFVSPDVRAAFVYTPDDRLFAYYLRDTGDDVEPLPVMRMFWPLTAGGLIRSNAWLPCTMAAISPP